MNRNKLIATLFLILAFFFTNCKKNDGISIEYNDNENAIYLIYTNRTASEVTIPKIYIEMVSNEKNDLFNINFSVESDCKEKAWYYGRICSITVPDYKDSPESYISILPNESLKGRVCSLSEKFIFFENYDYVYVSYTGYLGKSNRIKLTKEEFLRL